MVRHSSVYSYGWEDEVGGLGMVFGIEVKLTLLCYLCSLEPVTVCIKIWDKI